MRAIIIFFKNYRVNTQKNESPRDKPNGGNRSERLHILRHESVLCRVADEVRIGCGYRQNTV